MTIIWIGGKKLNVCLRCGNTIINRNNNAEYCKVCSKKIRKDNCKKAMDKYNRLHGLGRKYNKK